MALLAVRGVTPDNWALNAMAIVTGIAFVFFNLGGMAILAALAWALSVDWIAKPAR